MLRLILMVPFLVVLVAFALSNPQPVPLRLWPTDFALEAPLSVAILIAAGVFFLLGAIIVWFGTVAARARARRAERRVRELQTELAARDRQPQSTVIVPPHRALASAG